MIWRDKKPLSQEKYAGLELSKKPQRRHLCMVKNMLCDVDSEINSKLNLSVAKLFSKGFCDSSYRTSEAGKGQPLTGTMVFLLGGLVNLASQP